MGNQELRQKPIFVSGLDGYHTYRIPAIIVSKKGTILAFCEGRKNSARDDGDIDLVLRRSFDNGRTWQRMQIIRDDGENTIGNPCPVVDQDTGTIWLPFCRNNDRVFITSSLDDGANWSVPEEITGDVKLSDWSWYATGPGHGIQLKNGRLFIPCDHRQRGNESSGSHVIYSDDHGNSWKLGGIVGHKINECEGVELADGCVYLNMRSNHGKNRRAYAWSKDGGDSWSEVKHDDTLIEPVCQASIARFDKNRVLFSNPASVRRERMTIKLSYDECQSWSDGKVLYEGPSAYSNLCVTPDMTICCLYERGEKTPYETITLAQFNLEWLTDGEDALNDK